MVAFPEGRLKFSPTTISSATSAMPKSPSPSRATGDKHELNENDENDRDFALSVAGGRPSSSPEGRSADGSADLDRKDELIKLQSAASDGVPTGGGREGMPLAMATGGQGSVESATHFEAGGSVIDDGVGLTNSAVSSFSPPAAAAASKIPKNPRDTSSYTSSYTSPSSCGILSASRGEFTGSPSMSNSPKRRVKTGSGGPFGAKIVQVTGGVVRNHFNSSSNSFRHSAGGGEVNNGPTIEGGSGGSSVGARSVPTYKAHVGIFSGNSSYPRSSSSSAAASTGPCVQSSPIAPSSSIVSGGNASVAANAATLDDDEQYMFEQRLTHDELGVAIRKISHSGKAQLRYVKCVPIRPPSSSDYVGADERQNESDFVGGVDAGGGGKQPSRGASVSINSGNVVGGIVNGGGGFNHGSRPNNSPYIQHQIIGTPSSSIIGGSPLRISDSASVSSKASTSSRRILEGIGRRIGRLKATNSNVINDVAPTPTSPPALVGGGAEDLSNNLLLDDAVAGIDMLSDGTLHGGKSHRALTWGKKNSVVLALDKFTCVRKGKTTERTMRNSSPGSRLLSIMTNVRGNESLDIEAPTMLDRDKFASAFARFLGVPLVEEKDVVLMVGAGSSASVHEAWTKQSSTGGGGGVRTGRSLASVGKKIRTPSLTRVRKKSAPVSAARSEPGINATALSTQSATTSIDANRDRAGTNVSDGQLLPSPLLRNLTPNSDDANNTDRELAFDPELWDGKQIISSSVRSTSGVTTRAVALAPAVVGAATKSRASASSRADGDTVITKHTIETMSESVKKRISLDGGQMRESMLEPKKISMPQDATFSETRCSTAVASGSNNPTPNDTMDNDSHVSSLTGGVDQEIVEELHQAIIELRAELDASRAEAARAVKVAEQAIQSAENCTSSDWNSTVTHKAAEAAAQAQRKSAEAIARARVAEDRLNAERKSTKFWRRQAQAAEEEAGGLKTRSAAAEVRQAVMMEELTSERRKAARMFVSLKREFKEAEKKQGEDIAVITERKRELEVELELMKDDCRKKELVARPKREPAIEDNEKPKGPHRMSLGIRRLNNPSRLKRSDITNPIIMDSFVINDASKEPVDVLRKELAFLRKKFELVRHSSMDEILLLRRQSEEWSKQAKRAVAAATAETVILREKFAAESAMRLKLLNSLQDIRGTVRVYCRPKPIAHIPGSSRGTTKMILKIPTHDILVLNEDSSPISFKYDRVFSPGASQYEVFSELEEPLISSLDGFNVTLLAFGQGGSGKTHTLLGDVNMDEDGDDLPFLKSYGVQLQTILQLFTIASHRTDRYKDAFSMTMVEVHNEKLFDLVSGTPFADENGEAIMVETRDRRDKRRESGVDAWPKGKLEIRTNIDGNTVVQGLVSIPIKSFEDVLTIWQESIANRAEQLRRQGSDWKKHGRKTNIITTIHITSVNIATGVGTEGRLQFVDMAASDIAQGVTKFKDNSDGCFDEDDIQFANKSIDAFSEVINARCQFDRSVPYRNSTLTHLLRDSLEADTKVLLLCCISSDEANVADTIGALRFAARMQKVSIGKATKHVTGSKE